jgi:hypothetical protein
MAHGSANEANLDLDGVELRMYDAGFERAATVHKRHRSVEIDLSDGRPRPACRLPALLWMTCYTNGTRYLQ